MFFGERKVLDIKNYKNKEFSLFIFYLFTFVFLKDSKCLERNRKRSEHITHIQMKDAMRKVSAN